MNTAGLIVGIIFLVVILYIITKFVQFYNGRRVANVEVKEIAPNAKQGKNNSVIKGTEIPSSSFSNEYSMSFWLKINDYKYRFREKKIIMLRGKEDGSNANPEIYLEPIENNMVFRIKLQAESFSNNGSNNEQKSVDVSEDNGSCESFVSSNNSGMIIPEPVNLVKEAFGNISDNEAPSDGLIKYSSEYFNDISGNNISWKDTSREERFNAVKNIVPTNNGDGEQFQDTDNVNNDTNTENKSTGSTNSIEQLMNEIKENVESIDTSPEQYKVELENLFKGFCNLITSIQSKKMAEDVLIQYNGLFDFLNAQFRNETMNVNPGLIDIISTHRDVFKGIIYLNNFDAIASVESKDSVKNNLKNILSELNNKMSEMKCEVNMNSSVETNSMIKEELMNLLKEKGKKLIVNVAREIDSDLVYLNPDLKGFDEIVLNGIPLQRWNHIVLSVYNNIVDIYHDGKLVKSAVLKGFPEPNTNDLHLHLDGGYDGKTSRITYINMSMDQDDVQNLYRKGPESSESFIDKITGVFKF